MGALETARMGPDYATDPVLGGDGAVGWVEVTGPSAEAVVRFRPSAGGSVVRIPEVARPHRDGSGVVRFIDADTVVIVAADGCLARVDLRDGARHAFRTPGHAAGLVMSPDGRRAAASFDDGSTCFVGVLDLQTDEFAVWSDGSFAWDPTWSPDGVWLAWVEWDLPAMPWDASRLVVGRRGHGGSTRRVLLEGDMGVSQPRFASDGALGFLRDRRLHWMPTLDDAPAEIEPNIAIEHGPAPLGPGQRSWAWIGNDVLCTRGHEVARITRTGAVTVLQAGYARAIDARAERWTGVCDDWNVAPYLHGVNARTVDPAPVARPEWLMHASPAGDIPSLYWRPVAAEPSASLPTIVEVHGGPIGGIAADWRSAQRAARWAERGWAVLVPGYRGTTGYGETWRRALKGQWGIADVADVACAIRDVADRGVADATRMVVSGASAGGFTALLVGIEHPELVRAVISTYGVTDLLSCAETTWRFESGFFDWLIGPLPQYRDTYIERSPATRATSLKVPLIVFQGEHDIVVTPDQADRLVAAARASGADVEDVRFADEGHGWKVPETARVEAERTEQFLRRQGLM